MCNKIINSLFTLETVVNKTNPPAVFHCCSVGRIWVVRTSPLALLLLFFHMAPPQSQWAFEQQPSLFLHINFLRRQGQVTVAELQLNNRRLMSAATSATTLSACFNSAIRDWSEEVKNKHRCCKISHCLVLNAVDLLPSCFRCSFRMQPFENNTRQHRMQYHWKN